MLREPRSINDFHHNSLPEETSNTNPIDCLPGLKSKQALRVLAIHRSIKARGALPNCKRLARLFSVNRRTILRDIKKMRETLGMPIEYSESSVSYGYASRQLPFDLEAFLIDQHPDLDKQLADHFREFLNREAEAFQGDVCSP